MASDEIDQLVDEWGEDTVRKAFWLQTKIKHEGLDGIHFMHDEGDGTSAESRMKKVGPGLAKMTIEAQMDENY